MVPVLRKLISIEPIVINRRKVSAIVLDPHIKKHPDLTDEVVIELVRLLAGTESDPVASENEFEYFVSYLKFGGKGYRLVWLLERGKVYIGVINAYRDRRIK